MFICCMGLVEECCASCLLGGREMIGLFAVRGGMGNAMFILRCGGSGMLPSLFQLLNMSVTCTKC